MKNNKVFHVFVVSVLFITLTLTMAPTAFPCNENELQELDNPVFFTLTFQGEQKEYTLEQLENLERYTGTGGHLKQTGDITGPYEYTGVRILTLLNQFPSLPETYKLITISTDGYLYTFTYNQIQGDVKVYDTHGNYVGQGGVTMLLAYKEHGEYSFYGGPLRIAWINDNNAVTDAPIWPKNITEIEIITPAEQDTTPPQVHFDKPENYVYLFDRELLPSSIPLIIGGITIGIHAYDEQSTIQKVLIIIGEDLKYLSASPPYQWKWNEKTLGITMIIAKAYDSNGNSAEKEIKTLIFNL